MSTENGVPHVPQESTEPQTLQESPQPQKIGISGILITSMVLLLLSGNILLAMWILNLSSEFTRQRADIDNEFASIVNSLPKCDVDAELEKVAGFIDSFYKIDTKLIEALANVKRELSGEIASSNKQLTTELAKHLIKREELKNNIDTILYTLRDHIVDEYEIRTEMLKQINELSNNSKLFREQMEKLSSREEKLAQKHEENLLRIMRNTEKLTRAFNDIGKNTKCIESIELMVKTELDRKLAETNRRLSEVNSNLAREISELKRRIQALEQKKR